MTHLSDAECSMMMALRRPAAAAVRCAQCRSTAARAAATRRRVDSYAMAGSGGSVPWPAAAESVVASCDLIPPPPPLWLPLLELLLLLLLLL